jgi:hypothetical protein
MFEGACAKSQAKAVMWTTTKLGQVLFIILLSGQSGGFMNGLGLCCHKRLTKFSHILITTKDIPILLFARVIQDVISTFLFASGI